jgi:AraC-like DNA-binding protein
MAAPWHRAPPLDVAEIETDDDTFLTVERWPREVFRPHFHAEFNWIVPMRPGRVVVDVEGREHTLDANHWICVFPWTSHSIVHVSDDCEVLSLFIPDAAMERAWSALCSAPGSTPPDLEHRCIVGGAGAVAQGLALAWGELRFSKRERDPVDDALEHFVTGWLWRSYHARIDSDESSLRLRVKLGRSGEEVANFFEAHLADSPFPWDELAEQLGQSRRTLQRQFEDALGHSPTEVLMTLRLERAKALLADPSRSVGDVALACGFTSQSHFTTAFRTAFGLAPGRFRAELLK